MNYYLACFQKYWVTDGRATRTEYWMFTLINFVALIACMVVDISAGFGSPVFYTIYILFSLVPSWTVSIRRMHDSGHSGWWLVLPIVNLIFLCFPSEAGANEYDGDLKVNL